MPIDRNELTVRENRILGVALELHLATLVEYADYGDKNKTEYRASLAHDIITTQALLADLKRRRRR